MRHSRILIQLDSDPQPSTFDAIVAIDSEVEQLLQYGAIEASNVTSIVHGTMFTRGPADLQNTAIFIGGSNVSVGESIAAALQKHFFGPIRVSLMLDGNGSNTTAAAAVLCAARHVDLNGVNALVLGGTGPVGGRVARLLLRQGAHVKIVSRDMSRAEIARKQILTRVADLDVADNLAAIDSSSPNALVEVLENSEIIFGCGAAGAQLLDEKQMQMAAAAKVAIDLNAVPPAGLFGIEVSDKAVQRGGRFDYGAIGVGGLKMKIHRASIQKLFTRNDLFLDAEEIFDLGLIVEQQNA